jgi:hypothetical protein
MITWPEGRLPWVGDAWRDYQNQVMNFDRNELSRVLSAIDEQKKIDLFTGASDAMLTGAIAASSGNPIGMATGAGIAAAQFGVNTIAGEMTADLARNQAKAKQRNKEGLMKNQPSLNYQVGYGLDYFTKSSITGGAKIRIETPTAFTSTDFTNYLKFNGWPCDMYATIPLSSGYIEGTLYSTPMNTLYPKDSGPIMDMLRREFANGFVIETT